MGLLFIEVFAPHIQQPRFRANVHREILAPFWFIVLHLTEVIFRQPFARRWDIYVHPPNHPTSAFHPLLVESYLAEVEMEGSATYSATFATYHLRSTNCKMISK
jgi:hypothetical protein